MKFKEEEELNNLMVNHQIQRGLSRVSIRKRPQQTKLEKLQMRDRDLKQDLKDKEFQLCCILELLNQSSINNEVT